ncbi:hypothetical protein CBR_g38808 [Chara braunii]|uniref:Cyclic nucleotide-binding domain-containing protein n=1 Tax=Chara braunii TaxID=69332 RepID=A0A388LQB7_CHABU|nr:hypothetical protein CBR_g38808 [Chara braunii]|eukprot:GBG84526.1 hypothetical protein CBR_g38808 [Chara braunii]
MPRKKFDRTASIEEVPEREESSSSFVRSFDAPEESSRDILLESAAREEALIGVFGLAGMVASPGKDGRGSGRSASTPVPPPLWGGPPRMPRGQQPSPRPAPRPEPVVGRSGALYPGRQGTQAPGMYSGFLGPPTGRPGADDETIMMTKNFMSSNFFPPHHPGANDVAKSGPLGGCDNPLCPYCPPVTQAQIPKSGMLRQRPGRGGAATLVGIPPMPTWVMAGDSDRPPPPGDYRGPPTCIEGDYAGDWSFDDYYNTMVLEPGRDEDRMEPGWWGARAWGEFRRYMQGTINPHSAFMKRWNKIVLAACIIALFIDPLFAFMFYVLRKGGGGGGEEEGVEKFCVDVTRGLYGNILLASRTITDLVYWVNIYLQFRLCYFQRSSLGPGVLITEPKQIAARYLKRFYGGFGHDFIAALPLPQVIMWAVFPTWKPGERLREAKKIVSLVVMLQYLPRMVRFLPLVFTLPTVAGFVFESSWFMTWMYLVVFFLFGHVFGCLFYMMGIQRVSDCLQVECDKYEDKSLCDYGYLDCSHPQGGLNSSCFISNPDFDYGIVDRAVKIVEGQGDFIENIEKYIYSLFWGLQNLASLADNLVPSTSVSDSVFAIFIVCFGLLLFGVLISNIQNFISSLLRRSNDMQVRRRDLEWWMKHRRLPSHLRRKISDYERYRWIANQGVQEEQLLIDLSHDLRRDVKLHLCEDLVRRVEPFATLGDARVVMAICERLQQRLFGPMSVIIEEGEPVLRMYFIIRGTLENTITMDNNEVNSLLLQNGDYFGEELLAWCLIGRMPSEKKCKKGVENGGESSGRMPCSSCQVKTVDCVVDTFSIELEDLQFVCNNFPQLKTEETKRLVKYFSMAWRLWATKKIQAVWKIYKRRKALRAQSAYIARAEQTARSGRSGSDRRQG